MLEDLVREAQVGRKTITAAMHSSGLAVLEGTVRSSEEFHGAERAARSAPGVTDVVNHLRIER